MNLSDFDYYLPPELIAQESLRKRSDARLLVLNKETGEIKHDFFYNIHEHFNSGDVLVLNDTRVLPARLFGKKVTGGNVEVLLTRQLESGIWEALLKPSGRVKKGQVISFGDLSATVIDDPAQDSGIRHLQFPKGIDIAREMNRIGHIPLPPYIDREDLAIDRELYQTVFAKKPGAVASPTAGLHFDEGLLKKIESKGIETLFITLHVGYGTFQPVAEGNLQNHKMHEEFFQVSEETAEKINFAKSDGRRIVACGTTCVRALESAAVNRLPPELQAKDDWTNIFIYPPYQFKIPDAIITNFHLPKTTLLMLISAFCGHENLMRAYQEAIREKYRFYSYGDAMLII